MTSDDLARKLKSLEQDRDSLVTRMDGLYTKMLASMPTEAANWIDKEIEKRVSGKAEYVQDLGLERIQSLKAKVNDLKAKLEHVVAIEGSTRDSWPHHMVPTQSKLGLPSIFGRGLYPNEIFKNVINPLGQVLDEFGLLDYKTDYPAWMKDSKTGTVNYTFSPGYENELTKEYSKLAVDFDGILKETLDCNAALQKAKAMELWKRA